MTRVPRLMSDEKRKPNESDNGEGCLETERSEGSVHEAKRPGRWLGRRSCAGLNSSRPVRRTDRPGVRALIVAWKPGNSGGAKGCRKGDGAMSRPSRQTIAIRSLVQTTGRHRARTTRFPEAGATDFMLAAPRGVEELKLHQPLATLLTVTSGTISKSCFR